LLNIDLNKPREHHPPDGRQFSQKNDANPSPDPNYFHAYDIIYIGSHGDHLISIPPNTKNRLYRQTSDMTLSAHLTAYEIKALLDVVQQSFAVRKHFQLYSWLREDVQSFLPHDILIVAWGDFSLGLVSIDVVSPLPGVQTERIGEKAIQPFVTSLFGRWLAGKHAPYLLDAPQGFSCEGIRGSSIEAALGGMLGCLVHGIKDQRGRHDCIYALLSPAEIGTERSKLSFRFLLPHIDKVFRQIAHIPEEYRDDGDEAPVLEPELRKDMPFGMSGRECEIMQWVRRGKTNQEIGMILDISAFAVKNHLQRIFRKLNVISRAQAVAATESILGNATK